MSERLINLLVEKAKALLLLLLGLLLLALTLGKVNILKRK